MRGEEGGGRKRERQDGGREGDDHVGLLKE